MNPSASFVLSLIIAALSFSLGFAGVGLSRPESATRSLPDPEAGKEPHSKAVFSEQQPWIAPRSEVAVTQPDDPPVSVVSPASSELPPSAATSVTPMPLAESSALLIRVRVGSRPDTIAIATSTTAQILDGEGNVLGAIEPEMTYWASATTSGVTISQTTFPSMFWVDPGESGLFWVEGAWYRGRLLLVDTGSELLAVNEVELEAYLGSVVGSEMPAQWNLEALKAQAVAARSYALAHLEQPANSWYDLGNDQRHQVYGGIATESEPTTIAVADTAGQVLVNPDNRAIVAYYAATDAISQRAHQGLGMSQQGAQTLATQGWSYLKILERYYTGAAIARLE